MKKLLISFLLAIFSISLFSQGNKIVLDSIISYDSEVANDDSIYWIKTYTYDASGNLIIEDLDNFYDPPKNYTSRGGLDLRTIYFYNENGNLVERVGLNWNESLGVWETKNKPWVAGTSFAFKTVYYYDQDENLIESIDSIWNNDTNNYVAHFVLDFYGWQKDLGFHRTFTYDTSGNLVEKIEIPHESWGYSHRVIFNYSDTEDLLEEISYRRATDTIEWEIVYTDIYTYDSTGKVTDVARNGPNVFDSTLYTYNAAGDLEIKEINSYSWDGASGIWRDMQNPSRETYIYDEDGNLAEEIILRFYRSGQEWRSIGTLVYYWSESSISIVTGPEYHQFIIYPNPTNNLLTIETEYPDNYSINITTLNGQKIFNSEMEGTTHQIDLSSFQKGVYFITVRSKEFVTTRKVIKL